MIKKVEELPRKQRKRTQKDFIDRDLQECKEMLNDIIENIDSLYYSFEDDSEERASIKKIVTTLWGDISSAELDLGNIEMGLKPFRDSIRDDIFK